MKYLSRLVFRDVTLYVCLETLLFWNTEDYAMFIASQKEKLLRLCLANENFSRVIKT